MSDTPRTMQREDLFKLDWLQTAQLSPDATKVMYAVSHIEGEEGEEKEYSTLYMLDVPTGVSRKMTSGKQKDTSPAWSPDGKTIAFVSDRAEKPQIYLLPVDGGEAQVLTDLKQGAGGPIWSPDGTKIAFTAGIDYGEDKAPDRSSQPYRVTRNIWRFDDIGDIDLAVNNLYVIDVAGGEVTQLTDHNLMVAGVQWHPDSSRLLYGAMMKPDQWYGFRSENFIIDLDKNATPVLPDWLTVGMARWTPDGSKIIFMGEEEEPIIGTHANMWALDTASGEVTNRSAGMELSIGGGLEGRMPALRQVRGMLHIDADGQYAYAQVQQGGNVGIYRFALSGDVAYEQILDGERCCVLLDKQGDTLLYAVDDITHTPDVYMAQVDGSSEQQLTHINDAFLENIIIMPESVFLQFKGTDGVDVEGWYVKPTTGDEGPYPTILWIHGGPHGAQGNRFAFDTHMLNGAGYGVMFVNHRASTGYGDAFSTGIQGDWGNLDYNDLMAGVDYAIELGLADADKLGCCGISGGGNLSTWIIGHTDRFKAAVPQNPVTSWLSFYGVSDIGVWFSTRQLGGHPHEIPEIYTKCSPLTYAHNCTTPTLMIQTERDYRCPVDQSEQFYTTLRANGCIVEMLRQPQGAHGGSIRGPLPIRKENLKAKLEWFNKYILDMEA